MSRLGVVVALRREAAALSRSMAATQAADRDSTAGARGVASVDVDVEISGIGPERATRAARSLVERGATALLSWGLAGGLDPDLSAGDLIVPTAVVDAAGKTLPVDRVWRTRVLTALGMAGRGSVPLSTSAATRVPKTDITLTSSPTLLSTPADKQAFRARTGGAAAVDMESAAVAAVAAETKLPFLTVRAICDVATETVPRPALVAMTPSGRLRPGRLMVALTRQPGQIPAMVRMGRSERQALACLAEVVRRLGPALQAP